MDFLGNCECGECTCNSGYTGKYCQKEKDQEDICKKLEPCILSKFFSEDSAQDCTDNTHFGDSIQLFGKNFFKACFGNLTKPGLYSKVVIKFFFGWKQPNYLSEND